MRWRVGLSVGLLAGGTIAGLGAQAQPATYLADGMADAQASADQGQPHRMLGWSGDTVPVAASGTMSLIFTPADRALTLADVQKIAEAWLVWHGNHDWRVTNLTSDADRVTFTIATAANVVIASFSMDRHTGALVRTG